LLRRFSGLKVKKAVFGFPQLDPQEKHSLRIYMEKVRTITWI